jgi:hypothetical protein
MLDPYDSHMVLRRQEMTRAEWLEAEEQAGRLARALCLLGRGAARRARAWRQRMLSIPTVTIEAKTTS